MIATSWEEYDATAIGQPSRPRSAGAPEPCRDSPQWSPSRRWVFARTHFSPDNHIMFSFRNLTGPRRHSVPSHVADRKLLFSYAPDWCASLNFSWRLSD